MMGCRIVEKARESLGARFRHQGRVPGPRGFLDCVGLVATSLERAGRPARDTKAYRSRPSSKLLLREISEQFVPTDVIEPGTIALFWEAHPAKPQHVAIMTGQGTLLSAQSGRGVVELEYDRGWQERLHSLWSPEA